MARVGVFVCFCGANIADFVDVPAVVEESKKIKDVKFAVHYKYMCSDPGQQIIKDAIVQNRLTSVVVAACSPRMHEKTFRRAVAEAGLNPYLLEIANIREHSSWVHQKDKKSATEKAADLIRMAVAKSIANEQLHAISVPVTKRALVIGGGIAGIQAALDIADAKIPVVLVEKSPSIGGRMAQLDETFPTLDCSQCILTPKMVDVASHPYIELIPYSEVMELDGFVGNYKVKIKKKASYVNFSTCTGCGACQQKCPVKVPNEYNMGIDKRKAIYTPFPQAVPNKPVIDANHCNMLLKGKCGICAKVCEKGAIDYTMKDEIIEREIGAVVVATGYDLWDPKPYEEYGVGRFKDIITSLEFERMVSANGPTGGVPVRPSDGKVPKTVVFIKCIGSRDEAKGIEYCSKICCMYTAKHAILLHHKVHDSHAYIFYMDIRAAGKGYEEFVKRAQVETGATYLRGRVSKIYRKDDKLIVRGEDGQLGQVVEVEADLVVLATAIIPNKDNPDLARLLGVSYDKYGYMSEAHPKLRPVETAKAGIFLAGCTQAPKDIPDTVSQASACAAKVCGLFSGDTMQKDPMISTVNTDNCSGCQNCIKVCPYQAITAEEIPVARGSKEMRIVAKINEGVCQGCGSCAAVCRSMAISLAGFTDSQIINEIVSI
ncbi:MAG TPA: CoB--CoM heterodisulfide reductase iron-sulfur subunit A family protein [Bacteroidales bacterium]|nr:CoB--CoM heterodisulfide reductase iron-sulfur subunit A family protein [Bacteroidales bacterium]HPS72971.1 CoB--CoM heterodisulfide reductase iron-sulfur subunit A family protein [Bacteroidales bacterium]